MAAKDTTSAVLSTVSVSTKLYEGGRVMHLVCIIAARTPNVSPTSKQPALLPIVGAENVTFTAQICSVLSAKRVNQALVLLDAPRPRRAHICSLVDVGVRGC